MTLDDLRSLILTTSWFSRVGEPDYEGQTDYVRLSNMDDWKNVTGLLPNEPVPQMIEEGMDWLPTQRDQDDPIHGRSLEQRAETLGKKQEFAQQSLEVYKTTRAALRKYEGHPALKVGPHDFTETARGAAIFAVRRAAYEILLGEPGFWCRVMEIYFAGHWPCGILPNKQIVVL